MIEVLGRVATSTHTDIYPDHISKRWTSMANAAN